MNIDNTSEMQASHRLALKIWPLDEILRIQEHSLVIMPITFPIFNWYEPGFVKVFASIGHPTSSTKTLTQRSSGHINKLQFLVGQKKGFERIETKPFCFAYSKRPWSRKDLELTGVGWPSRSQSIFLRFKRSDSLMKPASAQAAYRTGAAWP